MALSSLFVLGNFNMYQFMEEKTLFKDYQQIIHTKKQVTLIEMYQVGCSGSRSWIGTQLYWIYCGDILRNSCKGGREAGQGRGWSWTRMWSLPDCRQRGSTVYMTDVLPPWGRGGQAPSKVLNIQHYTKQTTPLLPWGCPSLGGDKINEYTICQEVTNIMRKQAGEARD